MKFRLGMYNTYDERQLLILNDDLPEDFGPDLAYNGLLDRFRRSSWGVHQAQQPPRYAGNFPYDQENHYRQMLEDLGEAVHPVEHNVVALP